MNNRLSTTMIAGLAVGAVAASSSAQITLTDPVLVFNASNAQGSGTLTIPLIPAGFDPNGNFMWQANGATFDIMDGPNVIATVVDASVAYDNFDPLLPPAVQGQRTVEIGFAVFAGDSDTTFTVDSALSSFAPMFAAGPNALVGNNGLRATGGLTVTDSAGTASGATATGTQPGGNYFSTFYNGAAPATGITFADLVQGPLVAGDNSSTNTNENVGGPPLFTEVGNVTSISTQWGFVLSAGDQVSTTSALFVIPSPASVVLVGAGLLGLRRRR